MDVQQAIQVLRNFAAEPVSSSLAERREIAQELRSISDCLLVTCGESSASNAVPCIANAIGSATEENSREHLDSASLSRGKPVRSATDDLREELSGWKITDLKAALDECGIPRDNFLEKRELVQELERVIRADPSKRLRVATYCEICCRTLPTESFWPLTCKHMPCEYCLGRHLAVEAEKMQRNAKRHQPPCPFPECKTPISMGTAREFCKKVCKLWDDLGTREKLMKGAKYEIRECPQPNCVGIAYVEPGRSTAMCFICEHQWQVGDASADTSSRPNFSEGVRKCPKCQAPIERSFGCNHMECVKCGRKFDWDRADFANDALPRGRPTGSNNNGHFNPNEWANNFVQHQHPFDFMARNFMNGAGNIGAHFTQQSGPTFNQTQNEHNDQNDQCSIS